MNNALKIVAVVLLVAGTLSLLYKGFTYTSETHDAKIGPVELSVKEKERVTIPAWAGVAMIGAGGVLLLAGRKKM